MNTIRAMGLREPGHGVAILSNQHSEKAVWSRAGPVRVRLDDGIVLAKRSIAIDRPVTEVYPRLQTLAPGRAAP